MTESKDDGPSGARAAVVKGLKTLITPDEGGTKKEYEEFLEKIYNHVIISWTWGKDIGHVVKTMEDPVIDEPSDLDPADEGKKWKVRLWEQAVVLESDLKWPNPNGHLETNDARKDENAKDQYNNNK